MEPSAARGRAITQAEEETVQIIEDRVYAFSKDNPPCYTAQPGEVLQFNTLDCFSGRLTDETVTMKDMDFSYNITNPAAGLRHAGCRLQPRRRPCVRGRR